MRDDMNTEFEKATFAGGCFWCMEPLRYKFYRNNSGRDRFLDEVW